MAVTRHFLGWDTPLAHAVAHYLLPVAPEGPVDMEDTLVVAPTHQAARRLRETMARTCDERGSSLLSLRVVTPGVLLRPPGLQSATDSSVLGAWMRLLQDIQPGDFPGLFPIGAPRRDAAWALATAAMIQSLREMLCDGAYLVSDVLRTHKSDLEETQRWEDLGKLETLYLERLSTLGLSDPCETRIHAAENPDIPPEVTRLVIAAVPDPNLLALRAFQSITNGHSVEVLVQAPAELAEQFDEWGRPLCEVWGSASIDIPDPDRNVLLCSSPAEQSRRVIAEMDVEPDRFGPGDIAIGVPDRSVIPFLESDLAARGIAAFDPANRSLRDHPLFALIENALDLARSRSFTAFRNLIRHPDVLAAIQGELEVSSLRLLGEADAFQNMWLPLTLDDVTSRFIEYPTGSRDKRQSFEAVGKTAAWLEDILDRLRQDGVTAGLRGFLRLVYAHRESGKEGNAGDFAGAAGAVDACLREFERDWNPHLEMTEEERTHLLLYRISQQQYPPARDQAAMDLEGWLELPWNDSPFLLVTGMNESFVPEGQPADTFLPDSLRKTLGLRHDAQRLARDAFLMRGLIASRWQRTCFIAGRRSRTHDPLRPSRLLFRCSDDDLPARVGRLFGQGDTPSRSYPATVSFCLDPAPRTAEAKRRLTFKSISATMFRDYLNCPFRFYLKQVLRMSPLSDEKAELDAADFGTMIHAVLQRMGRDPRMASCTDPKTLTEFLHADAEAHIRSAFGRAPALPIRLTLDSAKERLAAAAAAQCRLVADGWEILRTEQSYTTVMNGMKVTGTIDRIDRHRGTGHIRVIDYKTSDRNDTPAASHFGAARAGTPDYAIVTVGGRAQRWKDLQLPVYLLLLRDTPELAGNVSAAYFTLPKAVTDTGMKPWDELDERLLQSAANCCAEIIERLQAGVFWPPAARPEHDDFGSLFCRVPEECVDWAEIPLEDS